MASVIRGDDNFDSTPTVSSNVPAFSAKPSSNQDIPNDSSTKLIFGTEILDTHSKFTDSKFTPTVAGLYFLSTTVLFSDGVNSAFIRARIMKNGSELLLNVDQYDSTSGTGVINLSVLVEANTTDYFEIFVRQNRGQPTFVQAAQTRFSGFKLAGV